jgi:Tol biopolymer transport system component
MPLLAGTQLGPYEIQSALGAGGMGEVYRALDRRLGRLVAIKVLPAQIAGKPEIRQRFEREARAIARLSHPHIRALYDIGQQDGVDFLVMEYLEGETLSTTLAAGRLGADQVLRYGLQIAEALDKAHREGFIHRDLKPANIMLTKEGAKLLDFGLARLLDPEQTAPEEQTSESTVAALTRGLTDEGTVLGTWQYMAPEQLDAKPADARTDIFSFGAVLYEMVTGRRAFEGKGLASLITAIVTSEPPPMAAAAPGTPAALERVIRKCLAKNPEERWQTARDLADELRWIAETGGMVEPIGGAGTSRAVRTRAWMAAIGLLLLGVFVLAGVLILRPPAIRRQPARFAVQPPAGTTLETFAVSPDGRYLVMAAAEEGRPRLWVRALESMEAQALPGTEGAKYPFWSPDSRFIGFFAQGKLRKIPVAGGPAQILCDAADGRSGTWNREGVIVFSPSPAGVLHSVRAEGGTPTPVTSFESSGGGIHRFPQFLPDGRHFLFLASRAAPGKEGVFVASLGSPEMRRLLADESSAAYAPGDSANEGYLLFVRQNRLTAQPFNAGRVAAAGEPFVVADRVGFASSLNYGPFSVSENGVLAYRQQGAGNTRLIWFDRQGREVKTIGDSDVIRGFALSPNGETVAVQRVEPGRATGDLWLYDLGRNTYARFTFEPARFPVWAPEGSRLAFSASGPEGRLDLYYKATGGAAGHQMLAASPEDKRPTDWSRDGRHILYTSTHPKTKYDLWILPVEGDRQPLPFLSTEFAETHGQFSPDGRWIAYASDEAGRSEVYVQPFPGSGVTGKWQISTAGGYAPRWRRDGRELYYLAPDRRLMAVRVESGAGFQAGLPEALFETRVPDVASSASFFYEVAAGGQQFLISSRVGETGETPITVVIDWLAQVRRR